ncbi:MAG: DNA-binding protein [Bacteroidales bacterium]|nr:DNA-binding protein [Bacteroidales bacterium]
MDAELKTRLDRIESLTLLAAKRVLSVKDVALLTGRSEKSIRNRLPEIPHFRGPMGICFDRSTVENWMMQVKITPVSQLMQ